MQKIGFIAVLICISATIAISNSAIAQVSRDDMEGDEFSEDYGVLDYGTVSDWTIRVDTTLNFGCFAFANYEGGTILRLGWVPDAEILYVFLYDDNWNSIQPGKNYPIKAYIGDNTPWDIEATGYDLDGARMLAFEATNDEFIDEFQGEYEIEFTFNEKSIAKLSLKGSRAAFEKIVECQNTVNSALVEVDEDPFITTDEDPFLNADDSLGPNETNFDMSSADTKICTDFRNEENQIASKTPMKIDDVTELASFTVNCDTKVLSYTKRILAPASSLPKGMVERKQRQHTQLHCNRQGVARVQKWSVLDILYDQNFDYIQTFRTTPQDCRYD